MPLRGGAGTVALQWARADAHHSLAGRRGGRAREAGSGVRALVMTSRAGEFVGIGAQLGRACYSFFPWLSAAAAVELGAWVRPLRAKRNPTQPPVGVLEPNGEEARRMTTVHACTLHTPTHTPLLKDKNEDFSRSHANTRRVVRILGFSKFNCCPRRCFQGLLDQQRLVVAFIERRASKDNRTKRPDRGPCWSFS